MCVSESELGGLKSGCESCSALYHLGALDWTYLCLYFPIRKMGDDRIPLQVCRESSMS